MNAAGHYAKAEEILRKYTEANDEWRAIVNETADIDDLTDLRPIGRELMTGLALMLQEAQVHATLATVRGETLHVTQNFTGEPALQDPAPRSKDVL